MMLPTEKACNNKSSIVNPRPFRLKPFGADHVNTPGAAAGVVPVFVN
jgi:hypothetical protein